MQTEDDNTDECFRESSCKHCKTAMLIDQNLVTFLACYFGGLGEKYYYLASYKRLNISVRF